MRGPKGQRVRGSRVRGSKGQRAKTSEGQRRNGPKGRRNGPKGQRANGAIKRPTAQSQRPRLKGSFSRCALWARYLVVKTEPVALHRQEIEADCRQRGEGERVGRVEGEHRKKGTKRKTLHPFSLSPFLSLSLSHPIVIQYHLQQNPRALHSSLKLEHFSSSP